MRFRICGNTAAYGNIISGHILLAQDCKLNPASNSVKKLIYCDKQQNNEPPDPQVILTANFQFKQSLVPGQNSDLSGKISLSNVDTHDEEWNRYRGYLVTN